MVSELVRDAIYGHIAYQIEDLDERNVTPQNSSRSETGRAHTCRRKFSVLKLSRLTELNQAEPNWTNPSRAEPNQVEPSQLELNQSGPNQDYQAGVDRWPTLTVDQRWPLTESWLESFPRFFDVPDPSVLSESPNSHSICELWQTVVWCYFKFHN